MNKKQYDRLERIIGELREMLEEEQDKVDNAPENLQNSELYERISENIDKLEEAIGTLEGIET